MGKFHPQFAHAIFSIFSLISPFNLVFLLLYINIVSLPLSTIIHFLQSSSSLFLSLSLSKSTSLHLSIKALPPLKPSPQTHQKKKKNPIPSSLLFPQIPFPINLPHTMDDPSTNSIFSNLFKFNNSPSNFHYYPPSSSSNYYPPPNFFPTSLHAPPPPTPTPPSPPLRQALPLLRRSPTRSAMEIDDNNNDQNRNRHDEVSSSSVTVALHIGLPSPSASEMATLLLSSNNTNHNNEDEDDDEDEDEDEDHDHQQVDQQISISGFCLSSSRLNKGQYWIPTPSQILIGPTQFSCPVCYKTFNRYNNMQVYFQNPTFFSFFILILWSDYYFFLPKSILFLWVFSFFFLFFLHGFVDDEGLNDLMYVFSLLF